MLFALEIFRYIRHLCSVPWKSEEDAADADDEADEAENKAGIIKK
jgi:hypothetical protein